MSESGHVPGMLPANSPAWREMVKSAQVRLLTAPNEYVYVGDRWARCLGSAWLGQRCRRVPGGAWRIQALVQFNDGTIVAAYWRCLRRVNEAPL